MKVKIGKYTNWYGPHQLAETLCFWAKPVKDEIGIERMPDWVHDFGEWLAHGSVRPEDEVGDVRPILSDDRHNTWIYKLLLWIDSKKKRKIEIKIDRWDTWSADHTLALIILPVLKQLKETTHGSPFVDDEDVPEELKSTSAPAKENEWDTDGNHFKRWEWMLDQMIWSFEQILDEEGELKFYTGTTDYQFKKLENGMYEMIHGENHTAVYDKEGHKAYDEKIAFGLRMFGKYYRALWD